jgi:hypothetical protein
MCGEAARFPVSNANGFTALGAGNVRTLHPGLPSASSGKISPTDGEPNEVSVSLSPAAASRPAGGIPTIFGDFLFIYIGKHGRNKGEY